MFIPLSGNLSQIFGRQPITLMGIMLFAVGSAVCGSARSMTALIIGRGEILFWILLDAWTMNWSRFVSYPGCWVWDDASTCVDHCHWSSPTATKRHIFGGHRDVGHLQRSSHRTGSLYSMTCDLQDLDSWFGCRSISSWRPIREGNLEMAFLWVQDCSQHWLSDQ